MSRNQARVDEVMLLVESNPLRWFGDDPDCELVVFPQAFER